MSNAVKEWMSLKEIEQASSLCLATLRKRCNDASIETKRGKGKGGPTLVRMTPETINRLEISTGLDFTEILPQPTASNVVVRTDSGVYTLSSTEEYGFNDFASIFRGVLPDNPRGVLKEFFDLNAVRDGDSKKVRGSRLIGLLSEANQGVFVGKELYDYLSAEAGVNKDEIAQQINRIADSHVKRLSPSILYIPKHDLPDVVKLVRKGVYGVEEWPDEVEFTTKQPVSEPAHVEPSVSKEGFYVSVRGSKIRDIVKRDGGIELILEEDGVSDDVQEGGVSGVEVHGGVSYKGSRTFNVNQLVELTGMSPFIVRKRLQAHRDSFDLRRSTKGTGRGYEATLTHDNCQILGIPERRARELLGPEPARNLEQVTASPEPVPEPTPEVVQVVKEVPAPVVSAPKPKASAERREGVKIDISGREYTLLPHKDYTLREVNEVLSQVHQSAFGEVVVAKIFEELGIEDGQMSGHDLIRYLGRVNGMMVLSSTSTQRRLESMGIPLKALELPDFADYVKRAPGLREPYVLKRNLQAVLELVKSRGITKLGLENPDEQARLSALSKWEQELEKLNIMPHGYTLEKLIQSGSLMQNTVASIESTYPLFIREMAGFVYYNFNRVKSNVAPDCRISDFNDRYMSVLEEKGMVKNVVKACEGDNRFWLYVLKKGVHDRDIYDTLKEVE